MGLPSPERFFTAVMFSHGGSDALPRVHRC